MSEEQNQQPAVNPQEEILKIYIRKMEEFQADICRRLINAEMNLEIATNSFKQSSEQLNTAQTINQQLLNGLQEVTVERNKLSEDVKVQSSDHEEFINLKVQNEKLTKQRDDYYREMQHHIVTNNKLSDRLQKSEAALSEFLLKEQMGNSGVGKEATIRKKVAKVKG